MGLCMYNLGNVPKQPIDDKAGEPVHGDVEVKDSEAVPETKPKGKSDK